MMTNLHISSSIIIQYVLLMPSLLLRQWDVDFLHDGYRDPSRGLGCTPNPHCRNNRPGKYTDMYSTCATSVHSKTISPDQITLIFQNSNLIFYFRTYIITKLVLVVVFMHGISDLKKSRR